MNNASELQAGERIGANGQLYWSQARWEADRAREKEERLKALAQFIRQDDGRDSHGRRADG